MQHVSCPTPVPHAPVSRIPRSARRGTVYLFVLSTAAIAAALAVGGLAVFDALGRGQQLDRSVRQSQLAARAGLELALAKIDSSYAGRQALASSGVVVGPVTIAGYSVRVSARDPDDSNLAGSLVDPIRLTSTATAGSVQQTLAVTYQPSKSPVSALASAVHAGGSLGISGQVVRSSGLIGSDGAVSATSSTVDAPVYSASTVTGSTYSQTTAPNSASLGLPVAADVLSMYMAAGTTIPLSSLSSRTLSNCLLSPGSNPFGSTNAQGIYVIDCQNQNVTIKSMRLVGTLVLRNAGAGTNISGSVVMEPAGADLPVLIVDGTLTIVTDGTDLAETGINFNPASTPYRGMSNTNNNDKFANEIVGLVYVNGNVTLGGQVTIVGQLLASGNIKMQAESAVSANLNLLGIGLNLSLGAVPNEIQIRHVPIVTVPAGFHKANLQVVKDSATRVVQ